MQIKSILLVGLFALLPLQYNSATSQEMAMSTQELNRRCMTANIFFEARGESDAGKKAVAEVTVNRALSEKYPEGICNVVFQRKQFSWTHQQNWSTINKVLVGKVSDLNLRDSAMYRKSERIAMHYTTKPFPVLLNRNSLFYHHKKIKPVWSHNLKKTSTIGNHVFY